MGAQPSIMFFISQIFPVRPEGEVQAAAGAVVRAPRAPQHAVGQRRRRARVVVVLLLLLEGVRVRRGRVLLHRGDVRVRQAPRGVRRVRQGLRAGGRGRGQLMFGVILIL